MATTADPNEQNVINASLAAVTSNNTDGPKTGRTAVVEKFTPNYATRTATNVTTGQTESDTALIIN